jgi:hypothetical protein
MTQESRTEETVAVQAGTLALAPEQTELTAAEVALVVGGTEGGPGSPGDYNGVLSGKATPILF